MKRSNFTEEQIAYGLRQLESGTPVPDVCQHLESTAFFSFGCRCQVCAAMATLTHRARR